MILKLFSKKKFKSGHKNSKNIFFVAPGQTNLIRTCLQSKPGSDSLFPSIARVPRHLRQGLSVAGEASAGGHEVAKRIQSALKRAPCAHRAHGKARERAVVAVGNGAVRRVDYGNEVVSQLVDPGRAAAPACPDSRFRRSSRRACGKRCCGGS